MENTYQTNWDQILENSQQELVSDKQLYGMIYLINVILDLERFMDNFEKLVIQYNITTDQKIDEVKATEQLSQQGNQEFNTTQKCQEDNSTCVTNKKRQKIQDIENLLKNLREPREPTEDECCGQGCSPCVFDVYYDKLEKYEEKKEQYETMILKYEEESEEEL